MDRLYYFYAILLVFTGPLFANITFSELSKAQSHYYTLDNGLKVLIMSNPQTVESAASVSLVFGQADGPKNYKGLPHAQEHAMFLGSKNYPNSDDWRRFFKPNTANASTLTDLTRYHFKIESEYFDAALTRLHDLLFNPLFTPQGVKQSLQEVDEEFHRKNSDWRKLLSVMQANINPAHHLSVFGTGNYESFGEYSEAKKQLYIDLHKQYYVPENMVLVVYHSASLEVLKGQIKRLFGEQMAGTFSLPRKHVPLLLSSQQRNYIKVAKGKGKPSLDIRFEIPPRTNPVNSLLPELLHHYLDISVAETLKQAGLISNLSIAYQGDMYTGIMDIYIQLTTLGDNNSQQVIKRVLKAVRTFQNDFRATQVKACDSLNQRFRGQRQEIWDWLGDISNQLRSWQHEHYIVIDYCKTEVSESDLENFASYIKSNQYQIFHVTGSEFKADSKSKYYHAAYQNFGLFLEVP